MKKKLLIIGVFVCGFLIFSYPFLANYVSTTTHIKEVKTYDKSVELLTSKKKKDLTEEAERYNQKVKDERIDFVDPFEKKPTKTKNKSYYDALNIGEVMATLEIPKIDMTLPIYHGTSEEVLSRGVGHMENSALPIGGKGTHSVLTGHRGLPSAKLFRDLDKLKKGDKFFIHVLDKTYAYEITTEKIVLPDETDWLIQEPNKEQVTLLTCEPYMINTHRLLVTGERVSYEKAAPEVKVSNYNTKKLTYIKWCILSVFLIGIISVFYFVIKYLKKKRRGN
ncbi:class C sortase [Vagococcus sp. PNs007]|uniref:Class C sortase n=1 Tax=Vagococcus proximus TaxID=2991417 RepID=A0ABT5X180_9ENTE|nr:class C sortase [Vagococcus proximus]